MDVKSAFLYGKIKEEVYVCQPPGFEDPEFLDRVYKVEKALYGLHQAPRACTPMETSKPLLKDTEAKDVDVYLYRSMIGSLMYLTSSRPDIMFIVCACARFQVTPKVSHLHAVKRIFRYLKGQPKLGLWYSKDSPFDLKLILIVAMLREGKGFSGSVNPLFQTMMVQASKELEIAKLKEKVKKLERKSLGAQEDASKQGRKIIDLDTDVEEVEVEKVVSTAASTTTTTVDELTLVQTLIEIKVPKPKDVTTAATTTTTVVTRPKAKDKGKAKMVEPEKPLKKKDQILVDEEIA
ncbi:uncharacterized mitochondrial protein-like protein [Tanacetum coccineum]